MRLDASPECLQFLRSLTELGERVDQPSIGVDASGVDFLTRLRLWRDLTNEDQQDAYMPSSEELRVALSLLESIAKLMPDKNLALARMKEIAFSMDPNQAIKSCASCGECYAENRDVRADGSKKIGECRAHVKDLGLLELDALSKIKYLSISPELRRVASVYPIWDDTHLPSDGMIFYHLHPNLVAEDKTCDLCYNCHNGLKNGDYAKLYEFCLAKGHDYGDIRRLQSTSEISKRLYRDLSLGESSALSQNKPYAVMVQVSGSSTQKLQSHFVTFPIKGFDTMSKSTIFTNGSDHVSERVKVQFLTSKSKFKDIRSALLGGLTHAIVDKKVLTARLELYNAVNEYFRGRFDIVNEKKFVKEQDYDVVNKLPKELDKDDENFPTEYEKGNILFGGTESDYFMGLASSRASKPDASGSKRDDDDDDDNDDDEHNEQDQHEDELSTPNEANVLAMRQPPTTSLLLGPTGQFDKQVSVHSVMKDNLKSVEALLADKIDASKTKTTQQPPTLAIKDPEKLLPLNEYTHNNEIFLLSFPELYLMGQGVPSNGPQSPAYIQHLNAQYTNKFAQNSEFQALLFNQAQRQISAKAVSRKVKAHPKQMEEAARLFNSERFRDKVRISLEKPEGEEAKQGEYKT